jgi:hypothetical protein
MANDWDVWITEGLTHIDIKAKKKPKLIEWKKSKAAAFADEVAPDKIRFRIEKQLVRKAMGKKYGK